MNDYEKQKIIQWNRKAFKRAFLLRCAQEGRSAEESLELVRSMREHLHKNAGELYKKAQPGAAYTAAPSLVGGVASGLGSAFGGAASGMGSAVSGAVPWVVGALLLSALGIPVLLGTMGGHFSARAADDVVLPEEAQADELIDTYKRLRKINKTQAGVNLSRRY